VGEDGRTSTEKDTIERDDFRATTSNKQLNFVQHIKTLLKTHGRAAVVLPDNVLVFEKRPASETPWTTQLWIYDLRTNQHFTLKTNPLRKEDLAEFVDLYKAGNRHQRQPTWSAEADSAKGSGPEGRWRAYSHAELLARDKASLDIFWLKDHSLADSDNLPPPGVLAQEIVEDLQAALEQFKLIAADMDAD
jgi:type I restriction enzyme M protein